MKKKLFPLHFSLFFMLMAASLPGLSSTTDCPGNMTSGTFTGHFTDVIDRDGYDVPQFLFVPDNGTYGCVMIHNNNIRYNIAMNAFLLNSKVTLLVANHGELTGIGYRNDE
jgi:hypothetical protein